MSDIDTTPTSVQLEPFVKRMMDMRLPVEIIAQATETPVREIRAIIARLEPGSRLSPEEQEIAEKVRMLANLAIAEAQKMILWGSPDQKVQMMRIVLGNAARLIGQDNSGGAEEYRVAFMELMQGMRHAPKLRTIVTDEKIIDIETPDDEEEPDDAAGTSPTPFTTYHQE